MSGAKMKYFLSLFIVLSVGCKSEDETANVKTLDQLAGSSNVYSCQTDSGANYPDAKLIERIVIGEQSCSSASDNMSSDCKEIVKAIATVPKVFQEAFLELGGSIKVGGDTGRICGATLKQGKTLKASKISGIESCWAIAASDVQQAGAPDRVVVIAHRDMAAAKSYTTRVFGYFVSQALPYINRSESGGYSFDFYNNTNRHINDAMMEKKADVASQFVRDIKDSSEYEMSGLSNVLGEALEYVKANGVNPGLSGYTDSVKSRVLAFADFVSADAFDSMFCGGDSRLVAANKVFQKTIDNYKENVHPALEALAKNIAGSDSSLNLTTANEGMATLLQFLGIGAQLLKSMPKPALQSANTMDTSLAGGGTCGSGTCGSCQGCSGGNCSCSGGQCCAGGCCGGSCGCPGCTCNAGGSV
jgi:hypothetical protein